MSYEVFYGGNNAGQYDREGWNPCGTHYQVRTEIQKTSTFGARRRRRYWCINPTNSKIGWQANGTGGSACAGLGAQRPLGGGESGFSGKDQHFPGNFAGYKCIVGANSVHGGNLKAWSSDSKMNTASVRGNDQKPKSLWEQLIFGVQTRYGTTNGFCADAKNLSTVVHRDGRTCYQMLQGAGQKALADTKTDTYCATPVGRMDEKCKCINVAGSGFLNRCKANPRWAGCKEIMPRINELQTLLKGSNLTEDDFGNSDCIVPDICGGSGIYMPGSGKPNCAKKMEVCNQVMNQENVKAFGNLKAVQSCNFTGANSLDNVQKKRDEKKAATAKAALDDKKRKEEAAAAEKKRKEDAAAAAAAAAAVPSTVSPAITEAEVEDEEIEPDLDTIEVDPETGTPIDPVPIQPIIESEAIPEVPMIAGIPMDTTTMLFGGGFLFCCMLLILVMVSGRGGGGGGGGGGRRR